MISLEEFYGQWSRWKRGVCSSSDQKRGEIINNGIVKALSMCASPVSMEQFEIACVVVRMRNDDAHPHFKNLQAALKDSSSFRDKMHDALENAQRTHNDDFVFDALKVSIQASFHRFSILFVLKNFHFITFHCKFKTDDSAFTVRITVR
jgi:hypothetical protein